MAWLPVFCDNCGSLFLAGNIIGGSGGTVTITNSTYGPCPVCNSTGRILDGTYSLMGDVLTLLSAPDWSLDKLRQVEAALRAAQDGARPADEVLADVSVFNADLANYIRGALSKGWTALQVIAVLLAIVTFLQGPSAQQQLAGVVNSEQRIERVLDHMAQGESHAPPKTRTRSTAKRPKKAPKRYGKNKRRKR
jgi:hypothetical protein